MIIYIYTLCRYICVGCSHCRHFVKENLGRQMSLHNLHIGWDITPPTMVL